MDKVWSKPNTLDEVGGVDEKLTFKCIMIGKSARASGRILRCHVSL